MLCLVTGAAGFIGSHLCETLVSQGFSVIGLDNLSVGRIENLSELRSKEFQFIESDLLNLKVDNLPFDLSQVSYIFHLGALADIVPSIKSPKNYFEANVRGTFNILELARHSRIKKFLYAASSSCYGIPNMYPTPETATISPQYPYALTKYMGEELLFHWGKVFKLPVISLRLFNVFGPRARTSGTYGAVFGVFLAQRKAGIPLTIVGDGNQTRDFTYVSDVVDAFVKAATSNVVGEVFNVGSGGTYSVNDLAALLGGETLKIPRRPGEPDCTHADINKIKEHLGWRPKITFEAGVNLMLKNLDSWEGAPVWTPTAIERETELWFKYLRESDV